MAGQLCIRLGDVSDGRRYEAVRVGWKNQLVQRVHAPTSKMCLSFLVSRANGPHIEKGWVKMKEN